MHVVSSGVPLVMERWARFITKTPWVWIVLWPLAGALVWISTPRIPAILKDNATGFIPDHMPSQKAQTLLQEAFPNHAPASRAVVLFDRQSGLTQTDRDAIAEVARLLNSRSDALGWRIRATSITPYLKPFLDSPDGQATLVAVDLPAPWLTHSTVNRVREIRQTLADRSFDAGLEVNVTGPGALGELLDSHVKRDVDRTTLWAMVAVMALLLAIYRSPLAMLLPILTITLSLMVALGLLGFAASCGWPINGLVEMFIIVILVGTGVDYCLFIFARYREEVSHSQNHASAIETAIARTGPAILASAGTNAVALSTLWLAGNLDLQTTGPAIAAAIVIGAFAVLTLAPALMRLSGRLLFWPAALEGSASSERSLWAAVGRLAVRRPRAISFGLIALLCIPAAVALSTVPLYDALEEYPQDSSFVRGARGYAKHFFACESVSQQTLILSAGARLDTPRAIPVLHATLNSLGHELSGEYPVLHQRDLYSPLGSGSSLSEESNGTPSVIERIEADIGTALAGDYFLSGDGLATRVDLAIAVDPRSLIAMEMVPRIRSTVERVVRDSGLARAVGVNEIRIDLEGETPIYADMRELRRRDFGPIAGVALLLIYLILIWVVRSAVQSIVLIFATLLTYFATYGLTFLIFHFVYGLDGLNWGISFLLFVIIVSLGQDYNIYVVSRIREERRTLPPEEAISVAVQRTGRVVSGCGLIMAAAFASMFSGSLLVMKEFAVALSMGILIDTFLIRPLLVPSLILLLEQRRIKT